MNSNVIKILICGTGKFQLDLIEEEIARSFRNVYLAIVGSDDDVHRSLRREKYDFIILDWESGLELKDVIDIRRHSKTTPILIISDQAQNLEIIEDTQTLEKSSSFHKGNPPYSQGSASSLVLSQKKVEVT